MIVLDASLVIELLANSPLAATIRGDLAERDEPFIAPHLLDLEVANVLRNLRTADRIEASRCERILEELAAFPAERRAHTPLLGRIWELRHNFTAYDAAYIALAETTGATLYTCDAKLRKGHRAKVVVFSSRPN